MVAPVTLWAEVSHEIRFPQRDNQYVSVRSVFPSEGDSLEVIMPSWTPGSYQIIDYATHIVGFSAVSGDGANLETSKLTKNRWRIQTPGVSEVVVSYQKWAGNLAVQDNWVDSDYALINPAGIFVYSESSRAQPQRVSVVLPADWSDFAIALPGADNEYLASNFDELVDSPMLAGNFSYLPFYVGTTDFGLVTYGETPFWDGEKAVEDLEKISRAHLDFWGNDPFEREYLFINLLMVGRGGLEHDHSAVIMAEPAVMRTRNEYIRWMGLASHELFHAWNVRRMRPEALTEYNYEDEVYTRQLWIAEGLTSYYDNLLMFRADVITLPEFFELLAIEMHRHETQPGRLKTSAESASFDSWIKHYRRTPNSINSYSNYYHKGALIGFVVDTEIRKVTRNRFSLDDAMRRMYEQYGPEGPGGGSYPVGALSKIVTEMAGAETGQMLEALRTDTIDPDIDSALDWYGLTLVRDPSRQMAVQAGEPEPVDLGVSFQTNTPWLLIDKVFEGGAGAVAGVVPGDELIAIDGLRVTRGNLDTFIKSLRFGDTVILTLSRQQRLIERELEVGQAFPAKYLIMAQQRVRNVEERRLESWLGRPLTVIK